MAGATSKKNTALCINNKKCICVLNQILRNYTGRQRRPPGKESMEEFDREEFRAQLQKAAASEEYQKMLQTMSKAMEELGKSLAMVAEKLVEVVNNIDWDAIIKVLMEGDKWN